MGYFSNYKIDWTKFTDQFLEPIEFEMVKNVTWYQVYVYPKVFGFCVINGTITDAPDYKWRGMSLDYAKKNIFTKTSGITDVVKIISYDC